MELQISPILYRGVRQYTHKGKPGELGTLWYPAPVELAQVDAERYPHTLALGFILPIRWRWDLGQRDHLALRGRALLELAGIPIHDRNTSRAMGVLQRNLGELTRIGGLDRYKWSHGSAWGLGATCQLYPPLWAVDRTLHGIRPLDAPTALIPHTGADLYAWRASLGLTQPAAARRIGVAERTIRWAERDPDKPLSPRLQAALTQVDSLGGRPIRTEALEPDEK
jgi:DNA-binding XRE family transcriptional regulator